MSNPKMTILIISFNRKEMLEKCLYSIYFTSSDEERNIIIWDNNSTDDSKDFLGTVLDWPGVRVIQSDENIGTRCIFEMLKLVKTPYVLTLDCDCWIETVGWVSNFIWAYESDPKLCAIGFGYYLDERAQMGVDWQEVNYDKFSHPRFRCENATFNIAPKPHEVKTLKDPLQVQPIFRNVNGLWMIYSNINVPVPGTPLAGTGMTFRVEAIKNTKYEPSSGIITDTGNIFSQYLAATRPDCSFGWLLEHKFYHATGPWWNIGNMETFYKEKSKCAPDVYKRTYEHQFRWYEQAKQWSGWGRPLPNAKNIPELRGGP